MPKLTQNFVRGRMNKDLDERLVPKGEYRDGQNIQVSTSEGSDVGAVENVLGNVLKNFEGAGDWDTSFSLTNATTIGTVRDASNNKLYWFLTSDEADAILEFDQATGIVAPVLVDINNVLNFSTSNLITGVNILEGMLFWTDDNSEPKKIDIARFKAGSAQGSNIISVHTQVYGRDFIESDVTVIKQKPSTAPQLTMRSTLKTGSGLGCGVNEVQVDFNFADPTTGDAFNVPEIGASKTIQFKGIPDWAINDVLLFTASFENNDNFLNEYAARVRVSNITVNAGPPPTSDVTVEILSISQNINNLTYTWDVVLEEEEPLFENEFPRFAYRWKFSDNEYSVYSPFSSVAFIGNDFDYASYKGRNKGMQNFVRFLELSGFTTPPADVVAIDILYKDSASNNIYKIEDIAPATTTFEIKSNVFGNVIESNQLLRPFDAVPKKAKAQEIVANRLVYANYTHNHDVTVSGNSVTPLLDTSYVSTVHNSGVNPLASVKSMRNYQAGVVYLDDYGRETPVFTSSDAAIIIPKSEASSVNKLRVNVTSTAPDFASEYKIVIKETSNEYYNLALDRFYKADDGNVWLSFPSAERNKLSENSFIHLKKAHGSDESVDVAAKYKVLDIANEAPDDVARNLVEKDSRYLRKISNDAKDNDTTTIRFNGPTSTEDPDLYKAFTGNTYVRLIDGNYTDYKLTEAKVTDLYQIESGGPTGKVNTYNSVDYIEYSVVLKTKKGTDFDWYASLADDTGRFTIVLYEYEETFKKEYQGKFFVKINRDYNFDEYILKYIQEKEPIYDLEYTKNGIANSYPPGYDSNNDPPILTWGTKPVAGSASMSISYGYSNDTVAPYNVGATDAPFFNYGLSVGKSVYFSEDGKEEYYKIKTISDSLSAPDINGNYEVTRTITFDRSVVSGTVFAGYDLKTYKDTSDWDKYFENESDIFLSPNPAIFETEPLETAELDIYYDATNNLDIAGHGTPINLDWFNCYSFGNGVESNRINDQFNAPTIGKGVKVNSTIEEPYEEERKLNGLIFSGIFNSTSGINNTNQFLIAETITKDVDPVYGSIQKLHTRDTNLVTLCENKSLRILADKDALYNADGNTNITSSRNVLGQTIPFAGEFGISKNPESFAAYGFRAYYTDKARGAVIRLSNDGITVISDKNMSYYFNQELKAATQPLIGSYDEDTGTYNVRINNKQLSFQESVDGWTTRLTYAPEFAISLNTEYYTFNGGELYEHSDDTNRANFYGVQNDTTVTTIINDGPSSIKNFKTLSYEGDEGWTASITTNSQEGVIDTWKQKEGLYFNFIKGEATTLSNIDTSEFSVQGLSNLATNPPHNGTSYTLTMVGTINVSLQVGDIVYYHDGTLNQMGECAAIDRLNKTITVATPAITINPPVIGDFVLFAKDGVINKSGIVGYYANIVLTNTNSSKKELFAVNSEAFISSE